MNIRTEEVFHYDGKYYHNEDDAWQARSEDDEAPARICPNKCKCLVIDDEYFLLTPVDVKYYYSF